MNIYIYMYIHIYINIHVYMCIQDFEASGESGSGSWAFSFCWGLFLRGVNMRKASEQRYTIQSTQQTCKNHVTSNFRCISLRCDSVCPSKRSPWLSRICTSGRLLSVHHPGQVPIRMTWAAFKIPLGWWLPSGNSLHSYSNWP